MLLAAGGSREIAGRLVISVHTVDNHLQHAYRKLGVTRREEFRARSAELDRGGHGVAGLDPLAPPRGALIGSR